MTWGSLAAIQRLPAVRWISIWFILTPFAAKVTDLPWVQSYFGKVSLPFSWYIFYMASASFFAASIIYALRCPPVIQNYLGWGDFLEREGSFETLRPMVVESLSLIDSSAQGRFLARLSQSGAIKFRGAANQVLTPDNANWADEIKNTETLLLNSRSEHERLNDVFSATREVVQNSRVRNRILCHFLHHIGWLFLSVVLAQNAWSVWASWCKTSSFGL
jgi:hypothetical protein